MPLVGIKIEKGLPRAGFLSPSGMRLSHPPVGGVGPGEEPQTRAGSQAGRY